MAARINYSSAYRNAGNAAPKVAAAIVVLILLGVGGWFFFLRGPSLPVPGEQATTPAAGVAPAPGTAAPVTTAEPAAADKLNQLTVDQLFKEARTAVNENRIVAPPGNNGLEFYLKILEKEPGNSGAGDALRELFTFAASAVEQDINARNIDEATRVIELLSKADPNNYTLTILRSKLDAQRKIVEREEAQALAKAEADARRAAEPQAPATPTAPAATDAGTTASTAPATTGTPGSTTAAPTTTASATPPPTAIPAAPTAPAAGGGDSRDAELVRQVAPQYPPAALRRRQEGWVQVEFTVTADGGVANARVVDSDPPRTFDRAALEAVQRWNFKPALRNGSAVEATVKRRIEFKM